MAIIDYRKSIIHMTLKIAKFDPLLNSIVHAKNILILFRFCQLQNFPNFKRSYLKSSIMVREYFFHTNKGYS